VGDARAVGLAQLVWAIVLLISTTTSPTKQGLHDRFANSAVVRPAGAGTGLATTCLVVVIVLLLIGLASIVRDPVGGRRIDLRDRRRRSPSRSVRVREVRIRHGDRDVSEWQVVRHDAAIRTVTFRASKEPIGRSHAVRVQRRSRRDRVAAAGARGPSSLIVLRFCRHSDPPGT
jgi:hypothetical protein